MSRRHFIFASAAAAGTLALPGCATKPRYKPPGEKLNIAVVGAGGKGASDTDHCASENIVALCDADEAHCAGQIKKYPKAKFYKDFRKMLDEMGKSIDGVIVSTPDHSHAVVAARAMEMGKAVYCQKPLTQTVYEARYLRELADRKKIVTQMGNQGSSEDGLRRAVEVIQGGVIGPVRSVYVWTNRPIWPQGMGRPPGSDPIPPTLDWDVWIGPAAMRPYVKGVYHPFKWRGWLDFGTGALGDMACHTANMPFRALKLGFPTLVEAQTPPMNNESYPIKSRIRFEFPAREGLVPATLWWYDGGNPLPNDPYAHDGSNKPPKEVLEQVVEFTGKPPGSGCLLIGDKGQLFSPDDYGAQFYIKLNDEKEFTSYKKHGAVTSIPQSVPRNAATGDTDYRQHAEWIAAVKGGPRPFSSFDVAAKLTEIILLGCVAMRVGKPLHWDGPRMKAVNCPEAERYLRPQHRKGFEL